MTDPDYIAMDVKQLPKWVDLAVGAIIGFVGGVVVVFVPRFIEAVRAALN